MVTDTGYEPLEAGKIKLKLCDALDPAGDGALRFSSGELESLFASFYLHQGLKAGRFEILRPFVSFQPRVWSHLAYLLGHDPIGALLESAIANTMDSVTLRLLIGIAGVSKADHCATAICHQLVYRGRIHRRAIEELGFQITPFFDAVKNSLLKLTVETHPIFRSYLEKARQAKRWQEKQVLEYVLKHGPETR